MSIEKRLERIEAILDARGLDWDHPRVEDDHFVDASKMVVEEPPKKWRRLTDEFVQPGDWMNAKVNRQDVDPPGGGWIPADPCYFGRRACTLSMYFARPVADEPAKEQAEEPPKKWRILEPGEVVCSGDMVNAKSNPPSDPPGGDGWVPADARLIGGEASQAMGLYVARPVAEEPATEPEHPAGPMPDPGEGYRILIKDPPEDLTPETDDWWEYDEQRWRGVFPLDLTAQHPRIWYRRKIGFPAREPEPAWEPKVGDWVRVTRPEGLGMGVSNSWSPSLDKFDGKVGKIESDLGGHFHICGFAWPSGLRFIFDRHWLSLAEPPATEKPAEPEYREPVLPADCGKQCEFSDDGKTWITLELNAWLPASRWVSKDDGCWQHARIKKDA